MLIFLRKRTNHAQFWFGVQLPLKLMNLGAIVDEILLLGCLKTMAFSENVQNIYFKSENKLDNAERV